jgi:hypothetical protein
MDQVSIKYLYQHLPLQDLPKLIRIWIFGLKTNHLATLCTTAKNIGSGKTTKKNRLKTLQRWQKWAMKSIPKLFSRKNTL